MRKLLSYVPCVKLRAVRLARGTRWFTTERQMMISAIILSVCLLLGIADSGNGQCENYDFQLVNGNSTAGEVQMCHRGTWKYICDDRWTDTNAQVVCRLMGLPYYYATKTIESHFGGDIYTNDVEIVLDDVRCYGNESKLTDCFHAGVGLENCNKKELAGVVCKGPSFCKREEEGNIRLVGRQNDYEGILEICHNPDPSTMENGFWGLICDDHWDIRDTTVACRELGFTYNEPMGFSCSRSRYPSVTNIHFWLDDVNCSGNENRVLDCGHKPLGDHDCTIDETVEVHCDVVDPTPSPTESPTSSPDPEPTSTSTPTPPIPTCDEIEGQVYTTTDCNCFVCGEPMEPCGDDECEPGCYCPLGKILDTENMICVETCPDPTPFPSPIICPYPGQNYTMCACESVCFEEPPSCSVCQPGCQCPPGTMLDRSKRECVVTCSDPNECTTNGDVRLCNKTLCGDYYTQGFTQGDVEICYAREWRPVCDDYWTTREAAVVCGRLGFNRGYAKGKTHSEYESDRSPFEYWLDDVDCFSNEMSLFDCAHRTPIGEHNCKAGERAGADCLFKIRGRRQSSDNFTGSGFGDEANVTQAIAYINGSGIIGTITFSLVEPPDQVYVVVFLTGLNIAEMYDWHIHVYPINESLPTEHMRCHSAGPHYDPDNILRDSCNYEKDCDSTPESVQYCEAGDLTGRLGLIPGTGVLSAITEVDFIDIIGRSVVLHNTEGTRVACANIEPFDGEGVE